MGKQKSKSNLSMNQDLSKEKTKKLYAVNFAKPGDEKRREIMEPENTPMQRFLNELNKTRVISNDFKGRLISYGYQISEEAYERGIKEGQRREKEAKK